MSVTPGETFGKVKLSCPGADQVGSSYNIRTHVLNGCPNCNLFADLVGRHIALDAGKVTLPSQREPTYTCA